MPKQNPTASSGGGSGRSGAGKSPATPKIKVTSDAALKKSGIEKLEKIGKTTSEAHISFALRQGKITKQEAAAIDPKNFKILLDNSKTKTIAVIDFNKGKK